MYKNLEIIAEVKTKSPFGYQSPNSWDELFAIANNIGDIISIHTDPRWGGSFELITKAKSLTNKPILAKGLHQNDSLISKALAAGADLVLVVGRLPQIHQDNCLIEPLTLAELKTTPPNFKVVWNSRDLDTGYHKKETFIEARKIHSGWLCQASHIETLQDIKSQANAILVGTHLVKFSKELLSSSS